MLDCLEVCVHQKLLCLELLSTVGALVPKIFPGFLHWALSERQYVAEECTEGYLSLDLNTLWQPSELWF